VPFGLPLELTAAELVFALAMTAAGAVVQGAIGFGYALVVVPALLLVAPGAVPAAPLLLALPMVLAMAVRERRAIDRPVAARLVAGRVPGTVLGAAVVSAVAVDTITVLVGVSLLLTVALSTLATDVRPRPPAQLAVGFASGLMGTVASLGGPIMGLALQSRPAPELRATLATAFAAGVVLSLAALAVAGEVAGQAVAIALVLAPATLLGLRGGQRVASRLAGTPLRPAVLAFAAAGGTVAIAETLL